MSLEQPKQPWERLKNIEEGPSQEIDANLERLGERVRRNTAPPLTLRNGDTLYCKTVDLSPDMYEELGSAVGDFESLKHRNITVVRAPRWLEHKVDVVVKNEKGEEVAQASLPKELFTEYYFRTV